MSCEKRCGNRFVRHLLLWVMAILTFAVSAVAQGQNCQHYKMISTVEYVGEGQFHNQTEAVFTVSTEQLAKNQVRFQLEAENLHEADMSFVVDRQTEKLSDLGQDMHLWAKLSNTSIQTVQKVSRKDVGRTWKQQASTGELSEILDESLTFTVTAIEVRSEKLGHMVAVRALSQPFTIQTSAGPARAKVNCAYLFDVNVEDIYLSACVFETATTARGLKEILHSEVVTFKTDALGTDADFSDAGKNLGQLFAKVGILDKPLVVTEPVSLPDWVKSQGLTAAQAGYVVGSNMCEGALNPVSSVSMPAVKVIELQKQAEPVATDSALAADDGGKKGFLGLDWSNPWVLGGVIAGAVAIPLALSGGGGGGGGHPASP